MKIAIVTNSAWSAYNFRLNLAKALIKEGNEVIFIIPFNNNYSEILQEEFKCYQLFLDPKSLNPFKDLKTFFNLSKLYKKTKPDVILHFTIKLNIYGTLAAKFNKIQSLANVTGLGTLFIRRGIATYISEFLYKISLHFSFKIFFQNKEDLNYFLNKKIIKESNTQIIPGSGVDLRKFKLTPVDKANNKFIFLLIARLLKDKGIYEYIEAIKIVKKKFPNDLIEFQLLGEANSENKTAIGASELRSWINDNLIKYLGTSNHVERIIAGCDCVVLPSYREGMPRSILESFAVGRPVIVSDVPGCREIVDDNINGLLCEVKSSVDLSNKMLSMIQMSDVERFNLALNGRTKVENLFDEEIVISSYIKTINNIESNEKNI